ncbi:hypothetical protein CONPUDRAFT_74248 [Coniophora puteana RWD-64-598 SS2]|uniref:Uncharacterized protein n=1 Tax=Coniophora puteana (strain RWD-64-598) TaxID=741705 RepID=A0A5M3MLH1_CONPW|nr:uncharacterized protein CONPUDRAFT_74248 [Coniophora puteana RWD-64-598 SS2]EIW79943.1 hypothetical protein CONPUDRAFT_74248 [Coniophora puteana RWD-64-598 SS2]
MSPAHATPHLSIGFSPVLERVVEAILLIAWMGVEPRLTCIIWQITLAWLMRRNEERSMNNSALLYNLHPRYLIEPNVPSKLSVLPYLQLHFFFALQMWSKLLSAVLVSLVFQGTQAQVVAPTGTLASILPAATDPAFGGFVSDGGAGGNINGQNLLTLSDPAVVNADGSVNFPSAHTGYAIIDPTNPSQITIIGDYSGSNPDFWHGTPDNSGAGGGVINVLPDDIDCNGNADCFSPAPHTAAIPIPGNSTGALNVWPVHPNEGDYIYNTMFELNVQDPTTLNSQTQPFSGQRTVPVLFNVSQGHAGYGSRALTSGQGDDAANHFYLWEGDTTGLKVARAPWASRTDTTTWDYWHGGDGWVTNQPLTYNGDAYGNVLNLTNQNLFYGCDVRYIDRFNTFIITFSGGADYSQYIAYSTSGDITGPYSDPAILFNPQLNSGCAGKSGLQLTDFPQMHWDYYGTTASQTLVSWISCDYYTDMGIVEWS